MLDHPPELSSDAAWMLQDGHSRPEDLARALVDEFGRKVFYLCLSLLGDPKQARLSVAATFSEALINAHRYPAWKPASSSAGQPGFEEEERRALLWCFELALNGLRRGRRFQPVPARRVDRLFFPEIPPDEAYAASIHRAWMKITPVQRRVILLHYLHSCTPDEITALLRTKTRTVEKTLARFRQSPQSINGQISAAEIDARMRQFFQKVAGSIELAQDDLDAITSAALEQAGAGKLRRRIGIALAEAALVAVAVLLIGGGAWWSNRAFPAVEPTLQVIRQTVLVTQPNPAEPEVVFKIVTPGAAQEVQPTPFPEDAFYTVQEGDTLASIAEKFGGFSAQELFLLNRLAPRQVLAPGLQLLLPSRLETSIFPTPTPVDRLVQAPTESPNDQNRNAELPAMYRRFRWFTGGWQTLWVELVYSDFGPDAYIGPPRTTRVQAWLSGNQLLVISGPVDGDPQQAALARFDENRFYQAHPEDGSPWFEEIPVEELFKSPLIEAYLTSLLNPLYPGAQPGSRSFHKVGDEQLAGVDTEVVEEVQSNGNRSARFWIDKLGGLIMINQKYSRRNPDRLAAQLSVQDYRYNVDFPQELFDPRLPWRGGFAEDYTGRAEENADSRRFTYYDLPVEEKAPPVDFDPGAAQLTFQYPVDFDPHAAIAGVNVFADGYRLGSSEFGNPWTMICDRSPDGRKIAFVSPPEKRSEGDASIRWIDLAELTDRANTTLAGVAVTDMAFSPDNRQVAVFGQYDTIAALYLIDTETNQYRRLIRMDRVLGMAWDDDGSHLGVFGRLPDRSDEPYVLVIRAHDGRVVYSQPVVGGADQVKVLQDNWGIGIPGSAGGLDGCSASMAGSVQP